MLESLVIGADITQLTGFDFNSLLLLYVTKLNNAILVLFLDFLFFTISRFLLFLDFLSHVWLNILFFCIASEREKNRFSFVVICYEAMCSKIDKGCTVCSQSREGR